jgi:hypothetical protein
MEAMESMNIFSALFGIFRQHGLVSMVREGRSLVGFTVSAIVVSIIGGLAYGFAMGIGLGIETSIKDAIKVGLIVFLILLFSIPIFWLAFRLLGREERFGQVAAIPLTMVSSVSIILAITSPIVFLLSVLTGFNPEAVYIHIVIVDVAILVGLYLTGTLIYHAYTDPKQLIIPNVVGFLMMGVVLVVLLSFFSPFLGLRSTFSVGTDRLKDGLGIGVAQKVTNALSAAAAADKVAYQFQSTNENGDLLRDYTVTRLGDDYFIQVHLHAVPNETYLYEGHIWVLNGKYFTDFEDGRVTQVSREDLTNILESTIPQAVFTLPPDFSSASWRAYEGAGKFYATGTSQNMTQTTLVLDAATSRLSELTLESGQKGIDAEVRVREIKPAELDPFAMEASLNQAIVVGNVDRSDASMNEVVQDEEFFVIRFPCTWRAGIWNSNQRSLEIITTCGFEEGCPHLWITVYDLAEGKDHLQYTEELGRMLRLQPEYREISTNIGSINGNTIGIVEYLFDQSVKGELKTTHHIEYIFVGQNNRYHLDFSTPESQFENNRELFEAMAGMFTYLLPSS